MDYFVQQTLDSSVSVIYDANFIKRDHRRRLQDIATKVGAQYMLLYFKTPIDVAIKRTEQRTQDAEGVFKDYYTSFNSGIVLKLKDNTEEPIDEACIRIDGTKPYTEQVKTIKEKLPLH